MRSMGFEVYFGQQPPYRGAQPRGVQLMNNPNATVTTWLRLVDFLSKDGTDAREYVPGKYVCAEFAEELHNSAERSGIRCAFATVEFYDEGPGHALNLFCLTDVGWVFIDCSGQSTDNGKEVKGKETDTFAGWSRDMVAFVRLGHKLGFVHISLVKSLDYSFYQLWEAKLNLYEKLVKEYNEDVKAYNNYVRGRIFYFGTQQETYAKAWESRLRKSELSLRDMEREIGPVYVPLGTVKRVKVYF
jgi:hypothetical protein